MREREREKESTGETILCIKVKKKNYIYIKLLKYITNTNEKEYLHACKITMEIYYT